MSVPQHLKALSRANEVRMERAALKRQVYAGSFAVVELVEDPPEAVSRVLVGDLLTWPRRWGQLKATRVLRRAGVSVTRPVGQLTVRERSDLVAQLNSFGGGR